MFDIKTYQKEYYDKQRSRVFTSYPESKVCTSCKEEKGSNEFYKNNLHTSDGLDYYCKYCRNGNSIKSFRKDKGLFKCAFPECVSDRGHYAKGMCRNCYTRQARNGTPNSMKTTSPIKDPSHPRYRQFKDGYLRMSYGIALEDWESLAAEGCQICGTTNNLEKFHTDHDHSCCVSTPTCGKCTRGVLCPKCNTSVGKYETGVLRADHPLQGKIVEYLDARTLPIDKQEN